MITTPEKTEEHRPDGLNILEMLLKDLAVLKEENKALRESLQSHEERLNNLTLNIPDTTLNAIIARTLNMHAQVLMAATRPQAVPQEAETLVEGMEEEVTPDMSSD